MEFVKHSSGGYIAKEAGRYVGGTLTKNAPTIVLPNSIGPPFALPNSAPIIAKALPVLPYVAVGVVALYAGYQLYQYIYPNE